MEDKQLQKSLYHWSLVTINLVSFLINSLVVFIFIRFRKRFFPGNIISCRTQTVNHNKFLFSLVMGDQVSGFSGATTAFMLRYSKNRFIFTLFGLIPMFGIMLVPIFSLVFLTVDRLVATKYLFRYDLLMTHSRVAKLIFASWMLPFLIIVSQVVMFLTIGRDFELRIRNTTITIVCLAASIILITSNLVLLKITNRHKQKFINLSADACKKSYLSQKGSNSKTERKIIHLPAGQSHGTKKINDIAKLYLDEGLTRGNLDYNEYEREHNQGHECEQESEDENEEHREHDFDYEYGHTQKYKHENEHERELHNLLLPNTFRISDSEESSYLATNRNSDRNLMQEHESELRRECKQESDGESVHKQAHRNEQLLESKYEGKDEHKRKTKHERQVPLFSEHFLNL